MVLVPSRSQFGQSTQGVGLERVQGVELERSYIP
jgi:hypothetical protein